MQKKYGRYIIAIALLLASIIATSYAFFSTEVDNSNKQTVSVESGTLRILYDGTNELTATKVLPGWNDSITFTVTNTGTLNAYYSVNWDSVFNELERTTDLIYRLTGSVYDITKTFPTVDGAIINGIGIKPGETHYYKIDITYLNQEVDQSVDMDKEFGGKILITTEDSDLGFIFENDNQILLSETEKEQITEFTLTSLTSSNQTVSLAINEITNTFVDEDKLTFTLKENGIEIIKDETLPVLSKAITNSITLLSKETREYELIASYNGSNNGNYNGIINVLNLESSYYQELRNIEKIVKAVNIEGTTIGTELTLATQVTIRGLTYWNGWHYLTEEDLASYDIDTSHAPYIVKFDTGAVQSISGEMINNQPIHTINYTGQGENSLAVIGLLSAVDANSTKTTTSWGETTIDGGIPTYDSNGGLILGNQYATLDVDQSRPVNEILSVNLTVKGVVPQATTGGYSQTILAISDASNKYVIWIGIYDKYLHVYSFSGTPTGALEETTKTGFISTDLTQYGDFNNQYLNIQVTAERAKETKVYLNGVLAKTFTSGNAVFSYGKLTIGDLRAGRGLKYSGSIYNFALYSEILSDEAITQNWNYTKLQLDI